MASKYHISPTTGRPNRCYAEKKPCPVGGKADHFPTREAAVAAVEKRAAKEHQLFSKQSKKVAKTEEPKLESPAPQEREDESTAAERYARQEASRSSKKTPAGVQALRKLVPEAEAFTAEAFLEGLTRRGGMAAETYNPGCEGCEEPYEGDCTCTEFTGEVRINKDAFTQYYYNEVASKPLRSGEKPTEEERAALATLKKVLNEHELLSPESYTAIGRPDEYGEELESIECHVDVESALEELRSLYSE